MCVSKRIDDIQRCSSILDCFLCETQLAAILCDQMWPERKAERSRNDGNGRWSDRRNVR